MCVCVCVCVGDTGEVCALCCNTQKVSMCSICIAAHTLDKVIVVELDRPCYAPLCLFVNLWSVQRCTSAQVIQKCNSALLLIAVVLGPGTVEDSSGPRGSFWSLLGGHPEWGGGGARVRMYMWY